MTTQPVTEPHPHLPTPEADDVCLDCGQYADSPLHTT